MEQWMVVKDVSVSWARWATGMRGQAASSGPPRGPLSLWIAPFMCRVTVSVPLSGG